MIKNKKYKKSKRKSISYCEITHEDIEMFREKELDNKNKKQKNICDTHQDGA